MVRDHRLSDLDGDQFRHFFVGRDPSNLREKISLN